MRNWISNLFGKTEKRDISISDPLVATILGPAQYANNEAALKLSTASRCISLISGAFASTDISLYRQKDDGSPEVVKDHPLGDIMINGTADLSAFVLKMNLMESLTSHGEAFAKVDFDNQGRLTNITPYDWHNVSPELLGNGRVQFRIRDPLRSFMETIYGQDAIFWAKWRPGQNGRGRSPLQLAAISAGIALGIEKSVAADAERGFRASGILSAPGPIGNDSATRLKTHFETMYSGVEGAGKVAVVGDGLEFKPLALSNSDNEIIENRRLNAYLVAQAYGVPPDVAGLPFHSTWSSASEANRQFVALSANVWSECLCQQLCAFVLGTSARRTLYLAANWAPLISGSLLEKADAYNKLTGGPVMTPNEARIVFDLPRIDGEDALRLVPVASGPPSSGSKPGAGAAG